MGSAQNDSNADIVRRGYAAFATGDLDTLREVFSPDILWHMPGRSAIAGDYAGIEAVFGFFGALMELTGGTFRAELTGCAEVAPGTVCAWQRTTATTANGALASTTVNVFRMAEGRAVEVTEHLADQYAYDAVMGSAITLPDARTADSAAPITT